MNRKIWLAGLFLGGLILVLIWMQGGFHSKVAGGRTVVSNAKAPRVKVVKVEKNATAAEISAPGTVVPKETARIASRVSGYVVEISAEAGNTVTKGRLLLRIDSREARERQAQAEAALESANAEAVKSEKDLDRYKTLFATQSVAKKELEDVQARHDMAKAAQQRATAALEEAATQVSYSDVTAPFDGVVSDRFVNKGDHVAPGKPLFNVYAPSSLELVAQAGEQYAAYLKEGATVTVKIPSIGLVQKSSIREIVPQRDERSRTINVKAPLPEGVTCAPGLYGTLTFDANVSESLSIPWTAVKVVGQLETVRVLDGDKTMVRQIKTGRRLGDRVEVVSGLSTGEQIVVE